jgi:ParB-like nuclease domain
MKCKRTELISLLGLFEIDGGEDMTTRKLIQAVIDTRPLTTPEGLSERQDKLLSAVYLDDVGLGDVDETPQYGKEDGNLVNVADVEYADYNPAGRTDIKAAGFLELRRQVEKDGKIYQSIMVREKDGEPGKYVLIDGHRRLTVAKVLKHKKIPAKVFACTDEEADYIYGSLNATARKHTGGEKLAVWAVAPGAVTARFAAKMQKLSEQVDAALLHRLAAKGLSDRAVAIAKRVAKHCEIADQEGILNTILKWLIELPSGGISTVEKGIKGQIAKESILTAIAENRGLELKIVAG